MLLGFANKTHQKAYNFIKIRERKKIVSLDMSTDEHPRKTEACENHLSIYSWGDDALHVK
jgi:hypothetical protein